MKEKKKDRKKGIRETNNLADLPAAAMSFARRHDNLVLFVLVYIVYNTVSRMTMSGDTNPAAFLPLALILHQTVFFDAFVGAGLGPNVAYAFPLVNDHYVSLFPIVTPILVTPVYIVSYLLYTVFAIPFDSMSIMILAKTCATIIAALSCVILYLVAKELFSRKIALATALVYAFATSTWSVSSQALWQHGTVELLLILMIYLIIRNERDRSRNHIIFLGLLSGLFVFNRPPDSVLLLPVLYYIVRYERKNLPFYAASAAATGLPFLLYNFTIFGNIFGGYKQNLDFFSFGLENIGNFIGLLVAPNVGLLAFSPVLILSVYGYLKLGSPGNDRVRQVLFAFGPVIVIEIMVYSFFGLWETSVAYSYGQRFLTGFVPVLAIFLGFALTGLFGDGPKPGIRQAARYGVVLLVVLSVVIQATGVFLYPLCPDRGTSSERTWDYEHIIVLESWQEGLPSLDSITTYSFPPLPPLFHLTIKEPQPAAP